MNVIAFIPARAGSKGVAKKNVRILGGKPLIAHTIESALNVKQISQVVVTTNCNESKAISQKYPVTIIDRPDELAQDDTPTYPVISHSIEILSSKKNKLPDIVLLLQCTSPLRQSEHISSAIDLFSSPFTTAVVSVIEVNDEHPARMYSISQEGELIPFDKKREKYRRQDLPKLYRRNGAIYALRYEEFLRQETIIGANAIPYVMPLEVSINIDTELDLMLAEAIMNLKAKSK